MAWLCWCAVKSLLNHSVNRVHNFGRYHPILFFCTNRFSSIIIIPAFYLSSVRLRVLGNYQERCTPDWCSWSVVFVKAARNQMVPPCAEWWGEKDKLATTHFTCIAFLPVWLHCTNARRNRCQDLNSFPLELEETTRTSSYYVDELNLKPITSASMKQLMWLRIVHSGDWCLHLALYTASGACQKRTNSQAVCYVNHLAFHQSVLLHCLVKFKYEI